MPRCSRRVTARRGCAESRHQGGDGCRYKSTFRTAADEFSPTARQSMNNAHIIGWGHTPFGKLDALDMEQLIRDAALPAVASAGLELKDIDGIFVGHFNGGFVQQDFSAGLVGVAIPEFRHVPAGRRPDPRPPRPGP